MAHKGYHVERAIAKRLNAKRIGGPGNMDIDGSWFSAEVEVGLIPEYVWEAVRKGRRHARYGQLKLVIQHEKGMRYDDDRVSMSLLDFIRWFGDAASLADTGLVAELEALRQTIAVTT